MGRGCKVGVNDIATLRPDIAEGMIRYNNFYNINSENDPTNTSVSGKTIIHYRCPNGHDTHKIANKFSQLKQVDGLVVCPECKKLGITKIPYIPRNLVKTYLIDFCNSNPEYKHLIAEWDYEKNNENNVHIEKMGKSSHDKVWWKCPDCGVSYDMSVSDRTEKAAKNNCPYCQRGRRVKTGHNDLATLYPHIAEEWDYEKNDPKLSPSTIRAHSSELIWWKCKNGHSWNTSVAKRTSKTNPSGCPKCKHHGTSLVETILFTYLKEKFANVLHRKKLWNLEYDIVLPEEKILIEYNGMYAHGKKGKEERDYKKVVAVQETEYKFLRIVETLNKELFTENEIYSFDNEEQILYINANHNTNYIALCSKLAEILNTYFNCNISTNVNEGIVFNAREEMQVEQLDNSLATTHPLLASMWHPTKNGNITPETQSRGSRYNAWWKCPVCGEEFQKEIYRIADKKIRYKCKNKCEEMYV